MCFDGGDADAEHVRYFFVRLPFGEKLKDLPLAIREEVKGVIESTTAKETDIVFQQLPELRLKRRISDDLLIILPQFFNVRIEHFGDECSAETPVKTVITNLKRGLGF